MNDPLWEFARAQNATMNWCNSEARLVRRDVRWFEATPVTGQRCAMAIYTVQCLEPKEWADTAKTPFANGLEADRAHMLGDPTFVPSEPGCGEKVRHTK
ncbi:MAG TPA: hypothetical protein VIT45_16110 [Allosphingosinicella sp.]